MTRNVKNAGGNPLNSLKHRKFGYFSADNTEYVISTLETPRPWYNRFGNDRHAVITSHTAGGYAIVGDEHRFQMNWYVPRYDESGRYIFLRDDDTGEYWSASYAPVRKSLDRYECRHGLAWSTFVSEKKGIACEYTVFVPLDGPVELWRVKITNKSGRSRRISAFPYMEWTMDDVPQGTDDLVYAAHLDAGFDKESSSLWVSHRFPEDYAFYRAFLSADFRPDGWDANRAAFVGRGRTLGCAQAVEEGRLTQTPAEAEVAIGALHKRFRLAAGGTVRFTIMAGMAQTAAERRRLRRRFLSPGKPDRALTKLRTSWDALPMRFEIETPDKQLDAFVNRWLMAHMYKQGASSAVRPIRIQLRNQMQDAMGMAWLDPEHSKAIISRLMRFHCSSGDALQWMSLGAKWKQVPEHVDTKLWIVYSTRAYLQETGDLDFLKHREPFYDSPKKATLLEMMNLAVDKAWKDRGPHGLSLIGRGDWNDNLDGMGQKGRGESLWMSMALHLALLNMAELAEHLGDAKRAKQLGDRAATLKAAINRHGWDGSWYLMGYTDDGRPVGTRKAKQGKIFMMPQVWAVLSGVATPARAAKLARAIDLRLDTPYGMKLIEHPFTKIDKSIGRVTVLAQGLNENGAMYVHANAFKLCADGLAGRGNKLHTGLRTQFPCFHDPDITLCEPFALTNYYRPPEVPRKYGATVRSWVTTAPAWFMKAVIEGLMGVRVNYKGIEFDPSIPAKWRKAWMCRMIRGAEYVITIENPSGVEHGVKEVRLNNELVKGNFIPFQPADTSCHVDVLMGR